MLYKGVQFSTRVENEAGDNSEMAYGTSCRHGNANLASLWKWGKR